MKRERGVEYRPVDVDDALRAVRQIASALELPTTAPVVLHATNNVVVHLAPAAVVAKVSRSVATAAREIAIAQHSAMLGAPVVGPAPGIGPRVYDADGLGVTLWQHYPASPRPVDAFELAVALRALHLALASAPAVPSLTERFAVVRAIVDDDEQMAAVDMSRRSDLRTALHALSDAALPYVTGSVHVLHGEPHAGNVVATLDAVRFCDFEGVCRGPLEWDLAFLPPDCIPGFGRIDVELVELLRGVVSAHVATLCWAKLRVLDDEGERWHAEHHLARAIAAARARAAD